VQNQFKHVTLTTQHYERMTKHKKWKAGCGGTLSAVDAVVNVTYGHDDMTRCEIVGHATFAVHHVTAHHNVENVAIRHLREGVPPSFPHQTTT